MAQLNVICHGMMLFVEGKTRMDILMPHIDEHDYRIGAPVGRSCDPYPEPLPDGAYEFDFPGGGSGLDDLDGNQHLLLHANKFKVIRRERISIGLPKPNRVRGFRLIGPPYTDAVLGTVPHENVLGVPHYIADVVAFIYEGIPGGTRLRFGGVFDTVVDEQRPANICLYSQIGPNSAADTGDPIKHRTGLNDLLEILSSAKAPDFELSAIGKAPPHIGDIGDGIDRCDLFSLFELAHFVTDGTGCSSGFVVGR
jgi:hypothetical protein